MSDLISRAALLEFAHNHINGYVDCNDIARFPSVDAEPVRHGRWILKAHDKRANYLWTVTAHCSECCDEEKEIWSGYFPNVPDWLARDVALQNAKQVKMSNYCPNCGARMDGDKDGK